MNVKPLFGASLGLRRELMSQLQARGLPVQCGFRSKVPSGKEVPLQRTNFGVDPFEFSRGLPGERTIYIHTTCHSQESPD
jgi:hypothetical protein